MNDDIRPRRTVELECSKCRWCAWFDPLDERVYLASQGIYVCDQCLGIPENLMKNE